MEVTMTQIDGSVDYCFNGLYFCYKHESIIIPPPPMQDLFTDISQFQKIK